MQSLKKNWLLVRKKHEEFGEFSPDYSKVQNFHLDGLFLSEVYEELGELSLEQTKSEKLFIDGLFLSKAYVSARKFQRDYV